MDFALTVSYRGGAYAGWQRQDNALAVQEVLEQALERLVGEPVRTVGSGRTDRGVHARGQVVSLRLPRSLPLEGLVHGTNRFLPEDVRVLRARRARPGFHAQRDAVAKEYRYQMDRAEVISPLESWNTVRIPPATDVEAMRRATEALPGHHDFSAFAKSGGAHTDPRRVVATAGWTEADSRLCFSITASGFLRGMVRALVGTLLEVGQGRRTPEDFARLLEGGSRAQAGPNAPARGLQLYVVVYPDDCFVGL